jgi:hypothetical protein
MNMLSGLSELEGSALTKVLRRTVVSAIVVGLGAVVVALLLSAPWFALGLAIGLGLAIVNVRLLDSGVAKAQTAGETNRKVLRRAMGTKSVTRLGIITLIAIGLLLLNGGLGIGAVAGLVVFQMLFVFNVGRVVMSQGIQ